MAVALTELRDLLLPGLWKVSSVYLASPQWAELFAADEAAAPVLSMQEVVILGTAAIIAKNPVVTRRFLPERLRNDAA